MTRIAFLITNRYQVHHYRPIAAALGASTFVIETRDRDFEVDEAFIRAHLPAATVEWVPKQHLRTLDGRFDVIVCQTPVLPNALLERSLVVAQQYSLGKETYQYGVWRSLANANLMYGPYSVDRVAGFAHARAVGNPLFDELLAGGLPPAPQGGSAKGLYLPTYGSLSSLEAVGRRLSGLPVEISVKLHHAEDPRAAGILPPNCSLVGADRSPAELIGAADFVITDFSGAAFDALYARRPLVLVGDADPEAEDYHRLSAADIDRSHLAGLGVVWESGRPLDDAVAEARSRLADDAAYRGFVDRFFVNHGTAGRACADAIVDLIDNGEPYDFARWQVRARTRELMGRNRRLETENRHLSRQNSRLRAGRPKGIGDVTLRAKQRARLTMTRYPRIEARLLKTWHDILQVARKREVDELADGTPAAGTAADGAASPRPPAVPPVVKALGATPDRQRRALAAVLATAAKEAGLAFAVAEVDGRPLCAVAERDKRMLGDVLVAVGRDYPGLVVHLAGGDRRSRMVGMGTVTFEDLFPARSIAVGPAPGGLPQGAARVQGLGVMFVAPVPAKQRVITVEPRAARVDWTAEFPELLEGAPPPTRPVSSVGRHHTVGEVDVVYTWVDPADPEWRRAHAAHSGAGGTSLTSADNAERFIDRDELRYSLRSVWMYAPFVRHIHLVTADQVPAWLDTSDERISVVSHRDVFPDPSVLPTFNSQAIEANLHRVPGVAEHFLYFNDDVFLGREVTVDDFFTRAGLSKVRFAPTQYIYEGRPGPDAIPTDWAAYNASDIIARDFGIRFDRKVQHIPHALRRSVLEEMERRYPEEYTRTRAARFRSATDLAIPSMFAHFYGVATGAAVEWPQPSGAYVYLDTGRADMARRVHDIVSRRPTYFCLNATLHTDIDHARQAAVVRSLLDSLYPIPSPFEIT